MPKPSKVHTFIVRKSFVLPDGKRTTKGDIIQAKSQCAVFDAADIEEYFKLTFEDNNVIWVPAANIKFYETEVPSNG